MAVNRLRSFGCCGGLLGHGSRRVYPGTVRQGMVRRQSPYAVAGRLLRHHCLRSVFWLHCSALVESRGTRLLFNYGLPSVGCHPPAVLPRGLLCVTIGAGCARVAFGSGLGDIMQDAFPEAVSCNVHLFRVQFLF